MMRRVDQTYPAANRYELTLRLLAPFLWAAVILWLSLTPSPPEIRGALGWDKLLHTGAYALLGLLVVQLLNYAGLSVSKAFWSTLAVCVGYGGLIEFLQWLMQAGRTAEWLDLLADALGAVIGCVIFRQAQRFPWRQNRHRDNPHG